MAERLSFSSEPVKTVGITPTIASESSPKRPNWPIEDITDGRGYHLPSEVPVTSDSIYNNEVPSNIQFWRNAERGILSRPLELIHFSEGLHKRMIRTFDLPGETSKPTVVFKAVIDDPKGPSSKIVHTERFSKLVPKEDIADFGIGIGRITEYATNLAAREFFTRNFPAIVAEPYVAVADWFTYRFVLGGSSCRINAFCCSA